MDLAPHAVLDGLAEFEDASRDLPFAVVTSANDQDVPAAVDHNASDADRVAWVGPHDSGSFGDEMGGVARGYKAFVRGLHVVGNVLRDRVTMFGV